MKSSFMRRILLILASYKEDTFELAVRFLQEEIRRTHGLVFAILYFTQAPIQTRMRNMVLPELLRA